jgi:hypothetical protein
MLKKTYVLLIIWFQVLLNTCIPAYSAELNPNAETFVGAGAAQEASAFARSAALVDHKNQEILLQSQIVSTSAVSLPGVLMEAKYTVSNQFLSPGNLADGAINNVSGAPTWVVPRENALAILNLISSASLTGDPSYLDNAVRAADYLVRVQDPTDGGWFDQYDYAVPVALSKSPTQTAEVMIAFFKLGYDSKRYAAMKKGAQFLMACQNPANKGGADDGLLGGGKDANGNYANWRWASDNSFAYLALKAAQAWAVAYGDSKFAAQAQGSAAAVLNGINTFLYNSNPTDDDYGVWKRAIDGSGAEMEPNFHEWINYAPQMLDLPATGVGSSLVGEWIHRKFQQADGSVVWNDTYQSTRKSPGFSFQAALVWEDLGQTNYADAAIQWAVNSGLWQQTPDQNGVVGGWIDWAEPSGPAPFWQRFIDTSFYYSAATKGGYDFKIEDATSYDLLLMKLQDSDSLRSGFNLLFGTNLRAVGEVNNADMSVLRGVIYDPRYKQKAFFATLPKVAALYRAIRSNATYRADFNLLFAASVQASGSPTVAVRTTLFNTAGTPTYNRTAFLATQTKAAALYRALRTNAGKRSSFNKRYKAHLLSSGSPVPRDRAVLFNITGGATYNQARFLKTL